MTLSIKQRAKVNAALCIIHDSGGSAQAVTAAARAIIAQGHPATYAYETAINGFAAAHPALGTTIGRVVALINSSSMETIGRYDHALASYISTGNDDALTALRPMIAADSIALAIRSGETTEADIAAGNFAGALGGEPTAAMQLAFAAATSHPVAEVGASQISPVVGSGMRGPDAQASVAKAGYTGFTPVASPFQGLTPAAAREAARARAAGEGQGYAPAPLADAA